MILTADVTKLKCIYFNNVKLIAVADNYGIDCNKDTRQDIVDTIETYLTLVGISPTICRTIECKILEILEKNTVPASCNRNQTADIPEPV